MREDDRRRVALQRFLNHFPRVDTCAIDGAPEQLDEVDDPMTIVDKDAAEGFEFPITQSHGQKVPGRCR